MREVTDPKLLARLNASETSGQSGQEVTDPNLLAKLNGSQQQESSLIGNAPGIAGEIMKIGPSAVMGFKHPGQALSNNLNAGKRGLMDIGQGIAQATKQFKEYLGYNAPGSTDEYTKKKDAERMAYEQSQAGQDPYAQLIRKGVNNAPYAAMGPALGSEAGLLSKMALSGGAGAGVNALSYVPEGGSRANNALIGGIAGAAAPLIPEIPGAIGKAKNVFNIKSGSREASKFLQAAHDKLLDQSSDIYNLVGDEVKHAGFKIPIENSLLQQSRRYLPKTDAVNSLISRAEKGEYQAIRDLQSDLGHEGTDNLTADLSADRHAGKEALELRNKINSGMADHFNEMSRPDLSALLKDANGKWQKMQELYYETNPTITKLVHPKKREIPKNIFTSLDKESIPTNRLLEAHPEVKNALNRHKFIENSKTAGKYGLAGLTALGAEELLRRK